MPLARYFIYVGGTLLLLLFVADFCLPRSPASERSNQEAYAIRIHSTQKWPDPVVFDTTIAMVASVDPVQVGTSAAPARNGAAPAVVDAGPASTPREAFAQLRPSKTSDVRAADKTAAKSKPHHQHVASQPIAKKRTQPLARLAWRQPQFGWFDQRIR